MRSRRVLAAGFAVSVVFGAAVLGFVPQSQESQLSTAPAPALVADDIPTPTPTPVSPDGGGMGGHIGG